MPDVPMMETHSSGHLSTVVDHIHLTNTLRYGWGLCVLGIHISVLAEGAEKPSLQPLGSWYQPFSPTKPESWLVRYMIVTQCWHPTTFKIQISQQN